jgi:predicted RNA-binding protein with EMAP domain
MDEDLKESKSVEDLIDDITRLVKSQGTNEVYVRNLIEAIKKFGCIFIKLTNRVECLTRCVIGLTIFLGIVGVFQILLAIKQLCIGR